MPGLQGMPVGPSRLQPLTPGAVVHPHTDITNTQDVADIMHSSVKVGGTLWTVIGWVLEAMVHTNQVEPVFQRAAQYNLHNTFLTAGGLQQQQIPRWYVTMVSLLHHTNVNERTAAVHSSFASVLSFQNNYRCTANKLLRRQILELLPAFLAMADILPAAFLNVL